MMFLLLRTQDLGSEVFTCPSSNTEKDLFGGGTNTANDRSNFTNAQKNLAYSMNNPYAKDGAIKDPDFWNHNKIFADFAIAADINPGTKGTGNNVTAVRTTSTAAEMKNGNSNNHDRDGQNVLYGDGHVEFQTNPFVGIQRDNIYVTQAGVLIGSPENENDSILLPTDD
jgi:prepilin-type processing-associated H-X9-DG protein